MNTFVLPVHDGEKNAVIARRFRINNFVTKNIECLQTRSPCL